ncbi:MAG: hypothetical protein HY855_00270 [Burkholderiales bacterium]|nr:hypothetical protein [Burkholderiales bacterium]
MNTHPLRLSLVVALALVAAASPALAQKRGGTLTVGSEAEFSGFNHAKAKIFNQNTLMPAMAVMEGLFAYEGKQIVPRLALSLAEAPDRLSATVKLRPGVKFHDGTPFNAEAVAAHYSWLMAPEQGINTAMLAPIKSVEKVEELTVRFNLHQPWTALRSALAIDSLSNLIGSPTAIKADPEGFHRKPVGTGPFVFKEWRSGDRVVLERNPKYWDPKLPHLDSVVFRVLPDANTRYQSIKSGEVDIANLGAANHLLDARKEPGLKVSSYEGSGSISWNFHNGKEPFNDARVRQAVVHAFNSQAMVDTFFLGTTKPTNDLFGPNSEWYCPKLEWRGYDLPRARALVAKVGKPIKFELVTTNNPTGRRMGTMLQQFVKEAGMEAELKLVEQSQNVRIGVSGDYQMDIWRYNDIGGDPDLVLTYYFGGKQPVSRHDPGKVNPLLDQARIETDAKKRHALYCQVAQIVSDEAYQLIPVRVTYHAAAQPHVKGLPPLQNSLIRVRGMWIEKK